MNLRALELRASVGGLAAHGVGICDPGSPRDCATRSKNVPRSGRLPPKQEARFATVVREGITIHCSCICREGWSLVKIRFNALWKLGTEEASHSNSLTDAVDG
jgi:hypothetical protein